jgi:hypothetical protein
MLHRNVRNDLHVVITQKIKMWKAIICLKITKVPKHNIKFRHPLAMRISGFEFRFLAIYVQRRLLFSRRVLNIVTTCFGLTGHHQVYGLL